MRVLGATKVLYFMSLSGGDHGRSIEPNGIMKGKNRLYKGQAYAVFISTVKRFYQPHPLSLYPAFLSRGRERGAIISNKLRIIYQSNSRNRFNPIMFFFLHQTFLGF